MSTAENEMIIKKNIEKNDGKGVSSIKDNFAKLNEELIDNNELPEKLDGLTNQFYIKYDYVKQKINETEEGIAK